MSDTAFTIVVAVNDDEVLEKNLLLSPGLLDEGRNQLILRRHFGSASLAYNSAITEAEHDIIIFLHQDLYLPHTWFPDLRRCLHLLARATANWGVLGCYGSRKGADGGLGRVYTSGVGWHGRHIARPEPVDTLDEINLIIRKSSGLRFDPCLPHFHLYGPDICLKARARGMVNYAFQGCCVHNTNQLLILPEEFYACYRYIRRKWFYHLPIYTSCIKISHLNEELYHRRLYETRLRILGMQHRAAKRGRDPRTFSAGCE